MFSSFSVALYYVVHLCRPREIGPETKKTADVVATRIGVIHAVVIGMMFTSVRMEYSDDRRNRVGGFGFNEVV
jgi:hypothetical protein